MADGADTPARRSRLWLFAPPAIVFALAAAWLAAWFVMRARADAAIEAWLAGEAAAGRRWSCPGRSIAGFPFRIEVSCPSLSLRRADGEITFGRVLALAQIYAPRHVVAEVAGPFSAVEGDARVTGEWRLLQASYRGDGNGLQRLSLVCDSPRLALSVSSSAAPASLSAAHVEMHLRPDPDRGLSEGAFDWNLSARDAVLPGLDAWLGGTEPADIDVTLAATQVRDPVSRSLDDEIERWRMAGGRIEIQRAELRKGARRIEASGELGLDDMHRPNGRLDLAAVGLEGMLGTLANPRRRLPAMLSGDAFSSAAASAPAPSEPSVNVRSVRLGLRLDNGRLRIGPLAVPGIRLPPLY